MEKKKIPKKKKSTKLSGIDRNITIAIISLIIGALIGIGISSHYFYKSIEYQDFREFQEKGQARPNISIEVYNKDYIALTVKTPNNLEIIEKLRIEFIVDGLVTNMSPRGNIINGEPCTLEKRPFFSYNDEVMYEKVIVRCDDILPSALNGIIVNYKQNHVINFDENINVEYYWNYKGQTQIEKYEIGRN